MSSDLRWTLVLALAPLAALAAPLPDRRAEENAVLEAVLRQQIEVQLDSSARARQMVICLGINPGQAPQSPSREFLARFRTEAAVRAMTECERSSGGAVEGTTGRPAVMVIAGPIDWVSADEAWVDVSYFRTRRDSGLRLYRVVKEKSGWVSLGPILRDGPA